MKRDMDLVRQILVEVEKWPHQHRGVLAFEGRSHEEIAYHVKLLCQAGLMEAIDATSTSGLNWIPRSLTWEGHEFLDAARDDTRWNRTKALVKDKAGAVSFEIKKQLLVSLAKQAVGL